MDPLQRNGWPWGWIKGSAGSERSTYLAQQAVNAIESCHAPGCLVLAPSIRQLRPIQALVIQGLGEKQYRVRFDTIMGLWWDWVSEHLTHLNRPPSTRLIDREEQDQIISRLIQSGRMPPSSIASADAIRQAIQSAKQSPTDCPPPHLQSVLMAYHAELAAARVMDREDVGLALLELWKLDPIREKWLSRYPVWIIGDSESMPMIGWQWLEQASRDLKGLVISSHHHTLIEGLSLPSDTPIRLPNPSTEWVVLTGSASEAIQVGVDHIESMLSYRAPSDVVVVAETDHQAALVQYALRHQGIASQLPYWPMVSWHAPIRPLVSYARLIDNPYDTLSIAACLRHPPFGLDEEQIEWVVEQCHQQGGGLLDLTLERGTELIELRVQALIELVSNWQDVVSHNESVTAGGVLTMIANDTEIADWLADIPYDWGEDPVAVMMESIEWITGANWGLRDCLMHFSLSDDQVETQVRGNAVSIVLGHQMCQDCYAMVVLGGHQMIQHHPSILDWAKGSVLLLGSVDTGDTTDNLTRPTATHWATPSAGCNWPRLQPGSLSHVPEWESWAVGDTVRHPMWGSGNIVSIQGTQSYRVLTIQFKDDSRTVMAKYAGLTSCT